YYIRAVGVAMLVAPLVLLVLYRKWRATLWLGLILGLGALPWVAASRGSNLNSYSNQLFLRDPYNPALGSISNAGELVGRVLNSARQYIFEVYPSMVLPEPTPQLLVSVLSPVLVTLLFIGFLSFIIKRISLPEVYVVTFLVILCIWPWTGDRFLLPIFPLLLA